MFITSAQKITVRTYLGWPPYASWDTTIESLLNIIDTDADMAAMLTSILTSIASVETEIAALHSLAVASKAEESVLNPDRYRDLRNAGRREVKRLAALLNLDGPKRDIFSTGSTGGPLPIG